MKAISINPQLISAGNITLPDIRLYADSAIGRDVMPLFLPDIPIGWQCRLCVAARVVRLGKNIAERFAYRYIDAISIVAELVPDTDDPQSKTFIDSGTLGILDSAITTGHWIECSLNELSTLSIKIADTVSEIDVSGLDIPQCLSSVSRYATVKTGDIIILESTALTLPMEIDSMIECSINDINVLRLKIK